MVDAGQEINSAASANNDLALLASWMTGSFSSGAQAAADSSYFDVRLQMVRIWPHRNDGYWLYVEQVWGATKSGYVFEKVKDYALE